MARPANLDFAPSAYRSLDTSHTRLTTGWQEKTLDPKERFEICSYTADLRQFGLLTVC